MAYYLEGRIDEAITTLEGSVARNPDYAGNHIMLAAAYAEAGRLNEARRAATEVRRLTPFFEVDIFSNYAAFQDLADRDRIAAALRKAGLE